MKRKKKPLSARVLDLMEKAFRAGHEIALHDAIVLCHEGNIPLPQWALAELSVRSQAMLRGDKPKKKMGRHAAPVTEQEQLTNDARCFEAVNDEKRWPSKKLHGEDAFSEAGQKLHLGREAVVKAYYRHRRRAGTANFYISVLHLGGDYVSYVQYNQALLGW